MEKMLAITLRIYHALIKLYFPMRLVVTAPALKLILILFACFLTPSRYFLDLNAVTVEHLSRYALLLGSAVPCAKVTCIN